MKSTDYVVYVRTLPCVVCNESPPSDPSHLRAIGMGGNRKKENERHFTAIPMCRLCHSNFHAVGITEFEDVWQINVYKVALKILAQWLMEQ